jgi:hypothetical protein
MPYIILRGRWCDIIFLKAHVQTENKTDNEKNSFYEEPESVLHKLLNTRSACFTSVASATLIANVIGFSLECLLFTPQMGLVVGTKLVSIQS